MTASATAVWCEWAWVGDTARAGAIIHVDDGRIAAVEYGVDVPPRGATRLDGLTLPGFANAHSHAFHRALRGRTHDGGGTFWTWRDRMYELAGRLDPDTYEALATAAFAEMVMAGYTAVGEFHYLHHGPGGVRYDDPNEVGRRLLRAAETAGIRITLLDTCYLHGGFGVAAEGAQLRFSDGDAASWMERVEALDGGASTVETPTVKVGAAIHSVRAVDPPALVRLAEWARHRGAVLHAHVSEQPKENADCLAEYGCSPVELLSRHGVLSPSFTAVHTTHLAGRDARRLGSATCSCCLCPTTERDLADGIGPAAALRAEGAALCIGSDSHAVVDPFEETRAVELDERLVSLQRGNQRPAELLTMATANGYRSLGWEGVALAAGSVADFVTVDLSSPRTAGTARADLGGAALFAASAADVQHVFVAGNHVVRDGTHASIDVGAALTSSIAAAWGEA